MNTSPIPSWTGKFSHREIEILNLISDGLSNREISQKLFLSLDTIKWYNKHLFAKLGVNNRTQALKMARYYRLLQLQTVPHENEGAHPVSQLPAQLTSYVGREREIAEIKSLLSKSRLVVLTGAGGTGKTRTALRVAELLAPAFPQGVWLVELAPLHEASEVPEAISRVLKVTVAENVSLLDAIKNHIGQKHLLLLLDNFEHLLNAAPLVTELLSAAPKLVVLATSRERLRLYGELEYPVRPLNLPDLSKKETPRVLSTYESVDLFIQRAQAANPAVKIDDANIFAAARICLRLDGLPLAIELAASLAKIYPPVILAQRLEHSLEVLPEGPRDLPARQRTLRATIEWSYNLLQEVEKRLLARMAIFSGGGTLEAIQYVCAFDQHANLVACLSSLVDKNLLTVREIPSGEPRFDMLETIHEFAADILRMGGEYETILDRLAIYLENLGEQYEHEIHGPHHVIWNKRIYAERSNLNAVLNRSLSQADPVRGLRLVVALAEHWFMNGSIHDCAWAELAIQKAGQVPLDLRAAVFRTIGELYNYLGRRSRAKELLRASVDLFLQIGDERNAAWAMVYLSAAAFENEEDLDDSIDYARRSLEIFRRCEDRPGISKSLTSLGESARIKDDLETAKACYTESLDLLKDTGERFRETVQLNNLAFVVFRQGEYQQAVEYSLLGLKIMLEMDIPNVSGLLYSLAGPLTVLGDPQKAARLLGAAQAQLDTTGAELQTSDLQDAQAIIAATRQALGETAFLQIWQTGYAMTTWQSIEFALRPA